MRDFDRRDQNRRTPQDQPSDNTGNCRRSDSVHVRHVRRDGRDRNARGYAMRYPRISEGQRNFYGGQGRPNDGTDLQLNAAAQDFIPSGNQRHHGSRSPNRRNNPPGSRNLSA
jgi:hypothetical protein